jgi:hypothetical protein
MQGEDNEWAKEWIDWGITLIKSEVEGFVFLGIELGIWTKKGPDGWDGWEGER